jgi:thymidylate synthase
MTKADETYLDLIKCIMKDGTKRDTRAGEVYSVFGKQIRFDLKEGFPLLTTKKVFTKGVLHELLWFLQRPYNSHGSMNIEYLVRNGVHIWDDDAYRWFKTEIAGRFARDKNGSLQVKGIFPREYVVCLNDDEIEGHPVYQYWIENDKRKEDDKWLKNITKEEFIDLVLQKVEIHGPFMSKYRFGDLGPVYGKQWRSFGETGTDQINNIINTLKTNPNDRRMLCLAFNPDQLDDMALPPCHVMMQFYARPLTRDERMKIFNNRYLTHKIPKEYFEWFKKYSKNTPEGMDVSMPDDGSDYDIAGIPKYGLSCMWTQRSVDTFLGLPFNIASYACLTHMIAKLVNMIPDELVGSLGDCHIYTAHKEAIEEQLKREGSDIVPELWIEGDQKTIEDFKYDDLKIVAYCPNPPIKAPLLVG